MVSVPMHACVHKYCPGASTYAEVLYINKITNYHKLLYQILDKFNKLSLIM